MEISSIHFKGHRCFKNDWAGFSEFKPVNVIIGRNNTGKSHLLDLIHAFCTNKLGDQGWLIKFSGILDQNSLLRYFPKSESTSDMGHNSWSEHGRKFANQKVSWETDINYNTINLDWSEGFDPASEFGQRSTNARIDRIKNVLTHLEHPLIGTCFQTILADRDIRPEKPQNELVLGSDGHGASNIIRRFLVTSNPKYPRETIQEKLLSALNAIFGNDGQFTEIQIKLHDEPVQVEPEEHWEIFLGEQRKGLVPLSNSGSGLKTVLLVLLNLLVIPEIQGKPPAKYTYAFEELENNLHPAILRRLLQFLEQFALKEKATFFLTTHSSTALDLFGTSQNAQIIHVTHDGESAKSTTVSAHFDKLGVISELGAKPSDLLQANGIIWLEGPSDCVYLNRWLDIYTDGKFQEGRDYQCAFYGGSLLARTQFKTPEEAEQDIVNLFRINPNIIVVCDGDRSSQNSRVKDRVMRIRAEVKKIPGAHIWVTKGREIENYIPGEILGKVCCPERKKPKDPEQFEAFFPRKREPKKSYLERRLMRKSIDKMELAVGSAPHMTKDSMLSRFDWEDEMKLIVDKISNWNRT